MQTKILNIPPAFIPSSVGNLLSPGAAPASAVGYTASAPYIVLRHVRLINIDTSMRTVSMYKGVTGGSAAGSQVIVGNFQLAAQSYYDWAGILRLDTADFLTGICDVASKVIWNGEGEIGLS
jgi:hypothetical protein